MKPISSCGPRGLYAPAAIAVFLCLPAIGRGASPQFQPASQTQPSEASSAVFRAEGKLALVRFQVAGKKTDFVTDLSPGDIEIREDGVAQEVAFFEGGRLYTAQSHTDVYLLFDCSGSVQSAGLLDTHVFSAGLLDEFPNARLSIWGFSGTTLSRLSGPTRETANLAAAMEALHSLPPGGTPLYLSLTALVGQLRNAPGDSLPMIVVISDGIDTTNSSAARLAAQKAGIPIFPVNINCQLDYDGITDLSRLVGSLQRVRQLQADFVELAGPTGGKALKFESKSPANLLDRILKMMAEEVRYTYSAGYYPTSGDTNSPHKVQVVLKNSNRGKVIGGSREVTH